MSQAWLILASHPGRSTLGVLGSSLSVIVIVLAGAYQQSARSAIDKDLSRLDATRISITSTRSGPVTAVFAEDRIAQLERLPGVEAVGLIVDRGTVQLSMGVGKRGSVSAPAYAVTLGALAAVGAHAGSGNLSSIRFAQTALLGAGIKTELALPQLYVEPSVRAPELSHSVVGVIDHAPGAPPLTTAFITNLCCDSKRLPASRAELVLSADPSVVDELAGRLASFVDPLRPDTVAVAADASPVSLRRDIERTSARSALIVAIAAFVIGAIANGLLRYASVRDRRREFGLRSALGARSVDVGVQVVAEGVIVGALGAGLGVGVGVSIGALAGLVDGSSLGVSGARCAAAAGLGVLSGALAGVLPALSAARIDPASALRA